MGKKTTSVSLPETQDHLKIRLKKGENVMKGIRVEDVYNQVVRLQNPSH